MAVSALAVVAVALATAVLLSERDLSSRWGANFCPAEAPTAATIRKQELGGSLRRDRANFASYQRVREEVCCFGPARKTVGIIERSCLSPTAAPAKSTCAIFSKARHPHASGALRSAGLDGPRDGAPGLGRHTRGRRTG